VTAGVFDPRGAWIADAEALWGDVREPEPVMAQAPLFERGLQ
jgi:hypothetical protein